MAVKIPTEDQEQIAFMQWARMTPIVRDYIWHTPNGGSRNKIEAAKLKRMGTVAGIPDIFLAIPRGIYHGLFIEMKRRELCSVSEEQAAWLYKLAKNNYCVKVAFGWENARQHVETYMKGV